MRVIESVEVEYPPLTGRKLKLSHDHSTNTYLFKEVEHGRENYLLHLRGDLMKAMVECYREMEVVRDADA